MACRRLGRWRLRSRVVAVALGCAAFAGAYACKEESGTAPPAKDSGAAHAQPDDASLPPAFWRLDASDDGWPVFGILGRTSLAVPKDLVVDMVGDPCPPRCNGDVHLEAGGRGTVRRRGVLEAFHVDPESLGEIVAAVGRSRFFDMQPEYGTGAPGVTITISMNQTTKKVHHRFGDMLKAGGGVDAAASDVHAGDRGRLLDLQAKINFAAHLGRPDGSQLPPAAGTATGRPSAERDAGTAKPAR